MIRHAIAPRAEWQARVEEHGLLYHTLPNGTPYWRDDAYYAFTAAQIDKLEAVTAELWDRCLDAAAHVIATKAYDRLGLPASAVPLVERTWFSEPPAVYGRFDLLWDGTGEPMLLEFNADTPTALLEAAVIQWYWLQDRFPKADQFNSLHEKLVAKWRELIVDEYVAPTIHVAHAAEHSGEDLATATYMRDAIEEAGGKTEGLFVDQIGWDGAAFVDLKGAPISSLFKLYPWEWLLREPFGADALRSITTGQRPLPNATQWIEPIWKMLLANKALVAILHELFPSHPNIPATYLDGPRQLKAYVQKPLLAREGANITVARAGCLPTITGGAYGGPYVWQALVDQRRDEWGDARPVIGSWVIDGAPAGIGIREGDASVNGGVTGNLSGFVPHLFE